MPEEAIKWIIDNQLGRRNLTAAQKIAVAEQMLTIEDKIKMDEEAREAQRQNLKNHKRGKKLMSYLRCRSHERSLLKKLLIGWQRKNRGKLERTKKRFLQKSYRIKINNLR